jgi:uncharacterized integral membrane protein
MADDPLEPNQGKGWSEFRDGKALDGKTLDAVEGKTRDRDVAPRAILAGAALILAVIFIVQNGNRAKFSFLFFDWQPRVWVVIVVSLLLGALLGQAVGLLFRRRKKDKKDN